MSKAAKAKVYKATSAAVSRFLTDKGFVRSKTSPTALSYLKNHSRGFEATKAYMVADAVAVVFHTTMGTRTEASRSELEKVREALLERFDAVFDVKPNEDRLLVRTKAAST